MDSCAGSPALLRAIDLVIDPPGAPLARGLAFALVPGLALVRGGDGRGKTTLLRVLAGDVAPVAGTVVLAPGATVRRPDASDPRDDGTGGRAWLDACRTSDPRWDAALEAELVDALGLASHVDKPLSMLSTGSRRKLALVAGFACGASVVLLDQPFAALDAGSRAVLAGLLADAAADTGRAWVIADHERPAGLDGAPIATVVDLGD
jgi:ABC-type transport system involved in cytochrome c biogenesis ATPase subunit